VPTAVIRHGDFRQGMSDGEKKGEDSSPIDRVSQRLGRNN
jgi:hypothetical protein